jgi:hypothetical protein
MVFAGWGDVVCMYICDEHVAQVTGAFAATGFKAEMTAQRVD